MPEPAPGRVATPSRPELRDVELPPWGAGCAVDGTLAVPTLAVRPGDGLVWERTDWLLAAAWYVDGAAERAHEARYGPIHSYSYRLSGWPDRMWSHAWANRIALFLRRWAARAAEADEDRLLGPLPAASVLLTHDVDAVRKTTANRIKQSAFHAANAARHLTKGQGRRAWDRLGSAVRFGMGAADYWRFPEMTELEDRHAWRSVFHVYAGPRAAGRGPRRWLMDPAYDPGEPRLRNELVRLVGRGWAIGLHPSFDTWKDPARMRCERDAVAEVSGAPVTFCRQHWLRFSWRDTWEAQGAAGIGFDSTLGFNDRPGFRNGAALIMRPMSPSGGTSPLSIPLVLMDSHLYDYRPLDEPRRVEEMRRWLGEVAAVRGQASVVWHQRVLSPDYGWGPGYRRMLEIVDTLDLDIVDPAELAGSLAARDPAALG